MDEKKTYESPWFSIKRLCIVDNILLTPSALEPDGEEVDFF